MQLMFKPYMICEIVSFLHSTYYKLMLYFLEMFLSIVPIVLSLQGLLSLHVTHVSDCGKTRGCWLLPSGCKDASDCSILLTWKHMGRALLIEMEANLEVGANGGWLAFGISKDNRMGNDTVFECHFFKKASGSVHLSHNTQKNNRVLKEATQMLLKDAYTELVDGRAQCGAEWILDFTVVEPSEKKLMHRISSGMYNLMFAYGALDAASEKKPHSMNGVDAPWRSAEQVRFCNHCSSATQIVDEISL